jgi:predicted small metal-binding protein
MTTTKLTSLSCNCGFTAENTDKYKVEAAMWHHAIHNHSDMLKSMTVEQLEEWLKNKDKQLTVSK